VTNPNTGNTLAFHFFRLNYSFYRIVERTVLLAVGYQSVSCVVSVLTKLLASRHGSQSHDLAVETDYKHSALDHDSVGTVSLFISYEI
jgi:hypothetical protein